MKFEMNREIQSEKLNYKSIQIYQQRNTNTNQTKKTQVNFEMNNEVQKEKLNLK